jgi:rubrerythrin
MFSGSELLRVAVNIERIGTAFYGALADMAQEPGTKETFRDLAQMEVEHEKTFQGMLDGADKYEPFEAYAEEYALYMQALADSAVFPDAQSAVEMAKKTTGPAEALQLAIQAEKDSILFYAEMRRITKEQGSGVLDRVIDEEKAHLLQLRDMLKEARGDWASS